MSQVQDVHSNAVDYGYLCEKAGSYNDWIPDCYLETISYNGVRISFYRENRLHDDIFRAAGQLRGDDLIVTDYRLKTIDIEVDYDPEGTPDYHRIRAYALDYLETDGQGNREVKSLLASVTPYGSDALLDQNNVISGGTSLPARTFTYDEQWADLANDEYWGDHVVPAYQPPGYQLAVFAGDVDGDGLSDYFYRTAPSGGHYGDIRVLFSNGSGFGTDQVWMQSGTHLTLPSISGLSHWPADVNGDGRMDIIFRASTTPSHQIVVVLSNGSGFYQVSNGPLASNLPGNNAYQWVADFNGDGMSDYAYEDANRDIRVFLSQGGGFLASEAYWGRRGPHGVDSGTYWALDVTGDGCADMVYSEYGNKNLRVMVSNCTDYFVPDVKWGEVAVNFNANMIWPMDANGDGLMDVVYDAYGTGDIHVVASLGTAFAEDEIWGTRTGIPNSGMMWPADMNGDGRTDLIYDEYGSGDYNVILSSGEAYVEENKWDTRDHAVLGSSWTWMTDVNGDGRPDVVYHEYGNTKVRVLESTGTKGHPMLQVDNGIGLTTDVTYVPLSNWVNDGLRAASTNFGASGSWATTLLPAGMSFWTTDSLATTEQVANTTLVTAYSYEGAKWSYAEKSFLGFEYAFETISDDGDGNFLDESYNETRFSHELACAGREIEKYTRNSDGDVSAARITSYHTTSSPYSCLKNVQFSYECEYETYPTNCRERKVEHLSTDYDAFGNVMITRDYGDTNVTGDEVTKENDYTPMNTSDSNYLTQFSHRTRVYAGIGTAGTVLSEEKFYYDDTSQNPTHETAPTKGLVKRKDVLNDQGTTSLLDDVYTVNYYDHDDYANPVKTVDARGNASWTVFDDTYHLYPIRVCNTQVTADNSVTSVGGCTAGIASEIQEWDVVEGTGPFGVVAAKEGWDGQRVETVHDVFARPVKTYGPEAFGMGLSLVAKNTYDLSTVPTTVVTRSYTEPGDDDVSQNEAPYEESIVFKDGYDRQIQSKQRAEDDSMQNSQVAVTGVSIHDRHGRMVRSYNPFFESGSEFSTYTTEANLPIGLAKVDYSYDDLGRKIQSTFPVALGETGNSYTSYEIGCVTSTDARGADKKTCKDALGRTISIEEDTEDSSTTLTTYEYDVLGRLTKVTTDADTGGAQEEVALTWNSLGQQLSLADANLGTTSYTYDANGNVTSKTDARGTVLYFDYDEFNRILRKCVDGGPSVDPVGLTKQQGAAPATASSQGGCDAGQVEIAAYDYDDPAAANGEGRLTTMTDLSGYTFYEYDARGRISLLTKRMDCDTGIIPNQECVELTVARTYDLMGRMTSLTYPDGEVVNYTYQERGLLDKVENDDPTPRVYAELFQYDVAGNMTSVDYGNGTVTQKTYDPESYRMTSLVSGDVISLSTSAQAPTAVELRTKLAGALADIDEDPDSPDANWMTADISNPTEAMAPTSILYIDNLSPNDVTDVNEDPDTTPVQSDWLEVDDVQSDSHLRVAFATPTSNLLEGAGEQEFRALIRRTNQSSPRIPTYRIELWEDGSQVLSSSEFDVPTGDAVVSFTWDASVLSDISGADVECYVVGLKQGGNPQQRNAVEIGAVEWNATVEGDNDSELRVSFDVPNDPLQVGADQQTFKVALKESNPGSSSTPMYRMELWENGALVRAGTDTTVVPDVENIEFSPDAMLGSTNLSGALTDIDDDPDFPDTNWLTAISKTADTTVRVSFPTPTQTLSVGADLQEFRVQLREHAEDGDPSAYYRIELWENGSLVRAGSDYSIPEESTLVATFTWDASELSDPTGADVELRVYGTGDSAGSWTGTVEIGAVEWNATALTGETVASLSWDVMELADPSANDVELRVVGLASGDNAIDIGAVEWDATVVDLTGSPIQDLTYKYDAGGNYTQVADRRSSGYIENFAYDKMSRLTSATETEGYGYRGYQYDNLGNIKKKCFEATCSSDYEEYDYSLSNLFHGVDEITDEATPTPNVLYSTSYDANGNMDLRTVDSTDYEMQWDYSNRLSTVIEDPSGTPTTLAQYIYDGHGARVMKVEDGKTTYYMSPWFEYREDTGDGKAVKHISGAGRTAMVSYVPVNGRTDFVVTASLGTWLQKNFKRFWRRLTHPRGNIPEHRIAVAAAAFMASLVWAFFYLGIATWLWGLPMRFVRHALGKHELRKRAKEARLARRMRRRFGWLQGRWGIRRSTSIPLALIIILNTVLIPIRPVAASVTETVHYLHADHLGGIQAVTDMSRVEQERHKYLPFGEIDSESGPGTSENDTGFAGGRTDAGGLVQMGNRFYDPRVGRWVSADPAQMAPSMLQGMRRAEWEYQTGSPMPASGIKDRIKEWQQRTFNPQDLNRFSYVLNNPLRLIDVDGYGFWKKFWKVVTGVFLIMVGLILFVIGVIVAIFSGGAGLSIAMFGLSLIANTIKDLATGASVGQMWMNAGISVGSAIVAAGVMQVLSWGLEKVSTFVKDFFAPVANSAEATGYGGEGSATLATEADSVAEGMDFVNPTGRAVRGVDAQGSGAFGAAREGGKLHSGGDYISEIGQEVRAPHSGTISRAPIISNKYGHPGIEMTSKLGTTKVLYIKPAPGITPGTNVTAGQVIGTAVDISAYGPGMTNHVHVQIQAFSGKFLDPTRLIPAP